MSSSVPSSPAIDMIKKLVSFDTSTGKSNLPLIDFVEDYLKEHGVSARRVYDESRTKANLFATIGPQDRPGYILSGHTDVVPVAGQNWSTDPFTPEIRDGRLYGRGSADMKGFVATALSKVPAMLTAELAVPLHLAFSYDEEIGCVGVRRLIDDMKASGLRPKACIVGEPTMMEVVVGHKGKNAMIVDVTGSPAHSSLAPHNVNAIEYAAALIVKIREIGQRLAAQGPFDRLYDVTHTTCQTGTIQGGTQLNIVPGNCRFEFEFRPIGSDNGDALVEEVKAYARDVLEPQMQAIAPDTGIAFTVQNCYPGLDTKGDEPVVALCKALARRNEHAKVSYGTEAGLFKQRAAIPSIVCGPGDIAQAHQADEFIELAQVAKCEAFIDALIAHAAG